MWVGRRKGVLLYSITFVLSEVDTAGELFERAAASAFFL
jgi:hypothetical protein